MKKMIKTATAMLLTAVIAMSLASCTFINSIREYTGVEETTIYTTPEEKSVIENYGKYIENSVEAADFYSYSTHYSVYDIKVEGDSGDKDFIEDAARQLRNFIMAEDPGSESGNVQDKKIDGTLLSNTVNPSSVLMFSARRNMISENVTNEDEENVTNENGEEETVTHISDNLLNAEMNYFETETFIDENGSETENVTLVAADGEIEAVFGSLKDKSAVSAHFDCVKDYIKLNDYTVEYAKASINTELNIDTETLNFANYTTEMTVTASVSGVGALSRYGDMTLTITVVKNTDYLFTYEAEE